MSVFTSAGKNILLDAVDGSGWYITLFNGDPTGAGTEKGITDFTARIALDTKFAVASGGVASSDVALVFTATGTVTVDYIALMSASTGGTLMAWDAIASKSLVNTETLTIASGDLDLTLTDS